jgi:hypothetical protein
VKTACDSDHYHHYLRHYLRHYLDHYRRSEGVGSADVEASKAESKSQTGEKVELEVVATQMQWEGADVSVSLMQLDLGLAEYCHC